MRLITSGENLNELIMFTMPRHALRVSHPIRVIQHAIKFHDFVFVVMFKVIREQYLTSVIKY